MASLPTAYASQRFGRKTLDFYSVEGEVVGADPRARSDERRLQDFDGARHTIRLIDTDFVLDAGASATVLRMQPGPAQRSRPVAVVNHDKRGWTRTHPGAAGLLARAGVSRAFNWTLTMGLFALAALALVWPILRAFLIEVDPALFSAAPHFDVGAWVAAQAPVLTEWSFAEAAAPLTAQIASAAPGLAPSATALVFGAGVLIAVFGVYLLRSWRLLWAPLFVLALGAVALGYGGVAGMVEPALAGLGLAAAVFLVGGLINRLRDAARLEGRIALLADHVLRQGPQDGVLEVRAAQAGEAAGDDRGGRPEAETLAPAIAASASALRQPAEDEAEDGDTAAPEQAGDPERASAPEPSNDDMAPESGESHAEAATPAHAPQEDGAPQDASAEMETGAPPPQAETQEAQGAPAEAAEPAQRAADDAAPIAEAEAPSSQAEVLEAEAPEAVAEASSLETEAPVEDVDTEPEIPAVERAEAGAPEIPADAAAGGDAEFEPLLEADPDGEASNAPPEARSITPGDGLEQQPAGEGADFAPESPDGLEDDGNLADPDDVEPSTGEAERPQSDLDAAAPAGLEPEEAERLRTDPRYASRAIVLPPPPPMPEPADQETPPETDAASTARTLRPSAPLPDNVVPIFAARSIDPTGAREGDGSEGGGPEDDSPEDGGPEDSGPEDGARA